ncbi:MULTISPECIES: sulfatase-like hydrolase/transferase [Haloarcula]|uniref:sulfatase-like hydrolase/transferase n=1 Tax=Haloarcula TaxID=2237 RepID=UPI0023EC9913|nr:sulfatase-like hydrolase/transferase [Halomicroarcula sp. XH51]
MNVVSSVASALPEAAAEPLKSVYFRYRSFSADRAHEPPSKPIQPRSDAPPHLLLIVIDALRPDFVPDLPIEFSHAIAPAPWTYPSVTSMHTGLRPSEHGAVTNTATNDDGLAIPAQTAADPHLPGKLESAGYDTYAGCAFPMPFQAITGWYQNHRCYSDAQASVVIEGYRDWRRGRPRTAGYLHLGDLHAPVGAPQAYLDDHDVDMSLPDLRYIRRYRTDFDETNPECVRYREHKFRLHRAALAYVSDRIWSLFEEIKDDTLVIICGDHGEALWEHQAQDRQITDSRPNHCLGHGGTPFDVVSRVPIGCWAPTGESLTPTGGWGSLRDIPATLLESVTGEHDIPGRSWHERIPTDRAVVCEGARYGVERKAVYRNEWKLVHSKADGVTLEAKIDGEEAFGEIPDSVATVLYEELPDRWETGSQSGSVPQVTRDQLESLGYM